MAYSRWSDSIWYAYWVFKEDEDRGKEQEELAILYGPAQYEYIPYAELKRCREDIVFTLGMDAGANQDEVDQLDLIIERFINEVDEHYDN